MSQPLPEPVLFLDNCLGSDVVANALRGQGIKVEVLDEHFENNTPDELWLSEVGKRGWVVLTKDKNIRRRQVERQALLRAGVAAFVLTAGDITGAEMAEAFWRAYPRMRKCLRDYELPFIASVSAAGAVRLLTDPRRRAVRTKEA